jgi:hypothetical protein
VIPIAKLGFLRLKTLTIRIIWKKLQGIIPIATLEFPPSKEFGTNPFWKEFPEMIQTGMSGKWPQKF